MGIEGFNPFISKNAPTAFTEIPATMFANSIIVIDAHNYVYTNMFVALKQSLKGVNLREDVNATHDNDLKIQTFLKMILRFIILMTSYSITPVFVFDGPNIYGKVVREKRKENNRKAYENIEELKTTLEQQSPLERTDEDIEELRRLKGSVTHITYDEMSMFKDVLRRLGIPVIQADGDGEHICCMMVREKKATAVFSRDTDCMVYGCPLMLTKIKKNQGSRYHVFEVTQFAPILPSLKLSYKSFVDLCIMAKCDYNTNIPKIAMVKSYKLLLKHKTIEEVGEAEEFDIECLNHEFCREQFRICSSISLLHEEHNGEMPPLTINKQMLKTDDARRILRLYECDDMVSTIVASYRNINKIVNRTSEMISSEGRIVCQANGSYILIKGKPVKPDKQEEDKIIVVADNPLEVLGMNVESYD